MVKNFERIPNVECENVRIIFRNFSGKEKTKDGRVVNAEGKRNFGAIIDANMATKLKEDGWNVKMLMPREDGDEPAWYLPVAVEYSNYPPNIYLISNGKSTRLDEGEVSLLDTAEIVNVDLVIRPYAYETAMRSGVKAYAKNMYVTIAQDRFAAKYEKPYDD